MSSNDEKKGGEPAMLAEPMQAPSTKGITVVSVGPIGGDVWFVDEINHLHGDDVKLTSTKGANQLSFAIVPPSDVLSGSNIEVMISRKGAGKKNEKGKGDLWATRGTTATVRGMWWRDYAPISEEYDSFSGQITVDPEMWWDSPQVEITFYLIGETKGYPPEILRGRVVIM